MYSTFKFYFLFGSARILRAVRIAARLCLSFSKEIESAVSDLSLSVLSISKVPRGNV